VPPEAAIICEKGTPAGALLRGVVVVMVSCATERKAMVFGIIRPTESVTVNPMFPVTAAVGVPEIVPLAASSVRPAGKFPAVTAHIYGGLPPVAVSTCE
jgi:hypothetical protein